MTWLTSVRETGNSAERLELGYRNIGRQLDVRAYARSTSESAATEQNNSAVTDHAITLNHVITKAKVIDRENYKIDRWIKEATYIRKEHDESMNRDEESYQLSHVYDKLFAAAATYSGERKLTTSFGRRQ